MQTLINLMALSSFVVSTITVVGGVYVYTNKDGIIESVKQNIVGELLPGELPGGLNSPMTGEGAPSNPPIPF